MSTPLHHVAVDALAAVRLGRQRVDLGEVGLLPTKAVDPRDAATGTLRILSCQRGVHEELRGAAVALTVVATN